MRRKAARADQQGFMLLTVVLALALLAAVAFLVSREGAVGAARAGAEAQADAARYLAEAGLRHALWQSDNNACRGGFTIPATNFGAGMYSATVNSAAATNAYSLAPDRDTFIKEITPTQSYSTGADLMVEGTAGAAQRALYHFDLSAIGAGARIASATLWLYVTANDAAAAVDVHPVTAAWTEAGATWSGIATSFEAAIPVRIPPLPGASAWTAINLTALAQAWANDATANHGIMLIAESSGIVSSYSSREYATTTLRPHLEITTAIGAVSPLGVTATGTLSGGPSRTLTRNAVTAFQPGTRVIIQPGAALDDAYTRSGAMKSRNYGASTRLGVSNGKNDQATLIRFDMAALPPAARIVSATLGLYLQGSASVSNAVIDLHRVSRSWVEGKLDGGSLGAGELGVTYNDYDGLNPWTNPGGDYDPAPIDSVTIPTQTPGWYQWDLTSQVRAWRAGEPNHGVLLRASAGTANGISFTSSDNAASIQRPRLVVTLADECGSAGQMPFSSGTVLLVVGNAATLAPGDVYRKALLEYWGYTVSLLDDNASQASFDSNVALNNAAYISATVDPLTLTTKLSNTTIGVVNEVGALNDELGIASASSAPVGAAINVTDTTHYITQVFAAGPLAIFSAAMTGTAVAGTPAPGLRTLADWGGAGALVTLDTGAALYPSGTAAGRRVMVPSGLATNTAWSEVNNNGRLILQRAIEWAKGSVP